MPKVSIIMPIYNKENYISETITSVLTQKFADFEVIIVNDGSTDNSLEIVRKYTEKDERFHVIDLPNGGVSNARNIGMENAKGEWIQFLDGDDLIDPEYLAKAVLLAERDNVDIIFTSFCMVDEDGNCLKKISNKEQGIADQAKLCRSFIEQQYQNGYFGYISNKLFRKEIIEKSHAEFPVGIKLAEDLDFYARLYPAVQKAYFASVNSFYYLQTESNYLNNTSIDYISQLKVNLDIRRWFIQSNQYKEHHRILDKKVSEYVYFVLFHANEKKESLKKYSKMIGNDSEIMECIKPQYFRGFEKSILNAVHQKQYHKVVLLFKGRTFVRSIFRRIKRNG